MMRTEPPSLLILLLGLCAVAAGNKCCNSYPETEYCRAAGNDECCSRESPCASGDGRCASSFDCAGDLSCIPLSCGWGDLDSCCGDPPPRHELALGGTLAHGEYLEDGGETGCTCRFGISEGALRLTKELSSGDSSPERIVLWQHDGEQADSAAVLALGQVDTGGLALRSASYADNGAKANGLDAEPLNGNLAFDVDSIDDCQRYCTSLGSRCGGFVLNDESASCQLFGEVTSVLMGDADSPKIHVRTKQKSDALWSSGSAGDGVVKLRLADCEVQALNAENVPVWATNTGGICTGVGGWRLAMQHRLLSRTAGPFWPRDDAGDEKVRGGFPWEESIDPVHPWWASVFESAPHFCAARIAAGELADSAGVLIPDERGGDPNCKDDDRRFREELNWGGGSGTCADFASACLDKSRARHIKVGAGDLVAVEEGKSAPAAGRLCAGCSLLAAGGTAPEGEGFLFSFEDLELRAVSAKGARAAEEGGGLYCPAREDAAHGRSALMFADMGNLERYRGASDGPSVFFLHAPQVEAGAL